MNPDPPDLVPLIVFILLALVTVVLIAVKPRGKL